MLGADHDRGYLKLGEIRRNLPGHRKYRHVVRLISVQKDKLTHVRGRIKEQHVPYTFPQGVVVNCRETRPDEETG